LPAFAQGAPAANPADSGGALTSEATAEVLEFAEFEDGSGYRWDLEASYGGDVNRFVFKTEGIGMVDSGVAAAEVRALYSRAIARSTEFRAGVRCDLEPEGRAYATLGVQGLLANWLDAEAELFLSDRGDVLASLEGIHDFELTQRLILEARAELELAPQDVPADGIGSGISSAGLGLRLRYEVRPAFAPYIGVTYVRALGRTADFARLAGEDDEETGFVAGVRVSF
jgi:copper resistance protein B